MRIMLTDSSDTCTAVGEGLAVEGHEVIDACMPDPSRQHECRGLRERTCPLPEGVDVAITTLERPQEVASAGTVCARRAGIPVVTVGRHDANHPDLVPALQRIAGRGDEYLVWSLQQAMADALVSVGRAVGNGETVDVVRTADTERIMARIPGPLTGPERSKLAVRLLDAATSTGRRGIRRDVVVTETMAPRI